MSVASYKKHAETLLLRMQFFCIDPKYSNYCEIIEHKKIQNEQSAYIDIWKLACITQYGILWNLPENEVAETRKKFEQEMRTLYARLLMRPTSTNLDRMWFVFFATGDINALKAAFEVSGNQSAKPDLQIAASDQFSNFRDEYRDQINNALEKDSEYFRKHETVVDLADDDNPMWQTQTVFDRFQEQIDAAMQQLDTSQNGELQGVLSRLGAGSDSDRGERNDGSPSVDEFMNDMFGDASDDDDATENMTKEEKEEHERVKKMGMRFDEIAKDVLKDRYVTKDAPSSRRAHRNTKEY